MARASVNVLSVYRTAASRRCGFACVKSYVTKPHPTRMPSPRSLVHQVRTPSNRMSISSSGVEGESTFCPKSTSISGWEDHFRECRNDLTCSTQLVHTEGPFRSRLRNHISVISSLATMGVLAGGPGPQAECPLVLSAHEPRRTREQSSRPILSFRASSPVVLIAEVGHRSCLI